MYNLKVFKLPFSSIHQKSSQLFMVLDGTGSMRYEYYLITDAYKEVFHEIIKSNQVYAIQFGSKNGQVCISNIENQIGGSGNFNAAFDNILHQMLQNIQVNIQANITICVVSDGLEPSDIEALKQLIDVAKKSYQIQFTSIAVSSGYPHELFQLFRDHFHNGALSCTNVQFVERSEITGIDNCRKNFINAFEMVKSQLPQHKLVKLTQNVLETLIGQPKHFALEGSVVASVENELTFQGLSIKQTTQAPYIAEFIHTSCQEFLKQQSIEKYKDSIKQAQEMKIVAQSLIQQIQESTSEYRHLVINLIEQMKKDLATLDEIGTGKLNLKNLTNEQKTKLLADFNPKKKEIQDAKLEHLNEELQTQRFYERLDELWMQQCDTPGQLIILGVISRIIDKGIREKKSQNEILQLLLTNQDIYLSSIPTFTQDHIDWVEQFIECKMTM